MENDVIQTEYKEKPIFFGRRQNKKMPQAPKYEEVVKKATQKVQEEETIEEQEELEIMAIINDFQHRAIKIKSEVDDLVLALMSLRLRNK